MSDTLSQLLLSASSKPVSVVATEYGIRRIEALFEASEGSPFVDEEFTAPEGSFLEEAGEKWNAVVTSVDGDWLKQIYTGNSAALFSANFRNYLGFSARKHNINADIRQSVQSEPGNFWLYNNGITILTRSIKTLIDGTRKMQGFSVINGAQTTGSIAEAGGASDVKVLCRFIRCTDETIADKQIRYNNTQNAITAADTKSKDVTQVRLKEEFSKLGINYVNRRSGIKLPPNSIVASVAGTALTAFHGDVQTAARNSADIFLEDKQYNRIFNATLTASHTFTVIALSQALDDRKYELKKLVDSENARQVEVDQCDVL